MYNNVGKIIKMVAKVICWIGIIITTIYGAALIVAEINTTLGCIWIIVGSFASWLGSLLMYAFGQIVDNIDICVKTLTLLGTIESPFDNSQINQWTCSKCGGKNDSEASFCIFCGEHK
ncbi:MAG: hypothetical protein J5602_10245 [Clostridia bacterium]|nr:hypothetical protein [Clostridia bacterium]